MLPNVKKHTQNKFFNYVIEHVSEKVLIFAPGFNKKGKKIMRMIANKQNLRELAMLQYQADKYRLAGNGFMCQHLNSQIRKLQEKLAQVERN